MSRKWPDHASGRPSPLAEARSRTFLRTLALLAGFVRLCTLYFGPSRPHGRDAAGDAVGPVRGSMKADLSDFADGLADFGHMTDRLAEILASDERWSASLADRDGLHDRLVELACDILDAPDEWKGVADGRFACSPAEFGTILGAPPWTDTE